MDQNILDKFNDVYIHVPHILIPNKNIDLKKYSCIACDQFSNDINYWNEVDKYVGDNVSTKNLIIPEARLLECNTQSQIDKINDTMNEYIGTNVYDTLDKGFIYVRRTTTTGIRRGLIVALDLKYYDFNIGSKSPIRATEKTVKDRLPLRISIRKKASLDLPHIMVLINDKKNLLFNYLKNFDNEKTLYDFELMMGGKNIKGTHINTEEQLKKILDILLTLKNEARDNLLYAIGDGNHSLAAAKTIFEETGHGRFALVEIVNIYDEGLGFFPIHRLVENVDKDNFFKETNIKFDDDGYSLEDVETLQPIIDKYLENHKEVTLEYMHDKDECFRLNKEKDKIGIVFREFKRDTLFDTVINKGSMARKSFSMGEARDKRYYLEAMCIV